MGSLAGVLAAKDAMRRYGIPGRIKFFGEPAEKMCGSKPLHAANGYYDDVDAFISFHPSCRLSLCNTVYWDIHCGSSYGRVFTFECTHPETWGEAHGRMLMPLQQVVARAPGALDAVCLMYTTSRYTNTSMLPRSGGWYISEAILVGGQATADHLAPRLGQIYYCWRAPTLEMQDRIAEVLENNAKHVAAITHCEVRGDWVQKNRIGLPNHALARLAYRNMELAGPPQFGEEAQEFGRQILRNLGHTPPERPIMPECSELHDPLEADRALREGLPAVADAFHVRRLRGVHVARAHGAAVHRAVHGRASGRCAGARFAHVGVECDGRQTRMHRSHDFQRGADHRVYGSGPDGLPTNSHGPRRNSPNARAAASAAAGGSRR